MEKSKRKPVAPFYAAAVLWIAYSVLLPLYRPIHYAAAAILSAAVFFVVNAICQGGGVIGGTEQSSTSDPKPDSSAEPGNSSGNPELNQMLQTGQSAIAELKRLDERIADPDISADIVRLEQISQRIFDAVREDPKRLPQIRRFMDYYLPTTLKLLNSYDRMSATGVSGENIQGTLSKVEGMMHTIVAAFEKQLDSLYGAEALDVAADISVLETMMAQEGLTGEQLKADEDTGIHLEL